MDLKKFFKDIKKLDYVVQRNWDNLPESCEVDGHNDLDLYCSMESLNELKWVIQQHKLEDLIDLRFHGDGY